MKLTLIMVMSLDGKTTRRNESRVYEWSSAEDQKHFSSIMKKGKVFIMGKNTFEAARGVLSSLTNKTLIVLVPNPKNYSKKKIPRNNLIFTNAPIKKVLESTQKKGFREMYLLGGELTNTGFFRSHLVDEILITVEPLLFGTGNGLVSGYIPDTKLKLEHIKRLNKKGTLLLTYKVLKKD